MSKLFKNAHKIHKNWVDANNELPGAASVTPWDRAVNTKAGEFAKKTLDKVYEKAPLSDLPYRKASREEKKEKEYIKFYTDQGFQISEKGDITYNPFEDPNHPQYGREPLIHPSDMTSIYPEQDIQNRMQNMEVKQNTLDSSAARRATFGDGTEETPSLLAGNTSTPTQPSTTNNTPSLITPSTTGGNKGWNVKTSSVSTPDYNLVTGGSASMQGEAPNAWTTITPTQAEDTSGMDVLRLACKYGDQSACNQLTQSYAQGGVVVNNQTPAAGTGSKFKSASRPVQKFAGGGSVMPAGGGMSPMGGSPSGGMPPQGPPAASSGPPMGGVGGGGDMPPMGDTGPSMGMEEDMGSLLTKGMEDGADNGGTGLDVIMSNVGEQLEEAEVAELQEAFSTFPVLDKVMNMMPLDWEGDVQGMGGPTSDEIPARLSDGEFVFTAKAVEQIGVDKLQKMMENAEAQADEMPMNETMNFKCGGLVKRKH